MSNDETKLPKWAQTELRHLRMRLEEVTAKLNTVAAPVDSNADGVSWLDPSSPTMYRGLAGNSIRVRGDGISVDAKITGGQIELAFNGKGHADCAIVPYCMNQIRIVRLSK